MGSTPKATIACSMWLQDELFLQPRTKCMIAVAFIPGVLHVVALYSTAERIEGRQAARDASTC